MSQPLKARELIKKTSEVLNEDVILVDDLVQFYWKQVHEAIKEPAYCNINIINLGMFIIAKKRMYDDIADLTDKIRNYNAARSFQQHLLKSQAENKLEYLKKCLRFVEKEKELKLLKRQMRNEQNG